jgi:hypothetical protein
MLANVAHDDTTNIYVKVTKQEVESELGTRPRNACVFSINDAHTEKLHDEETVDSLLVGGGAKL